MNRFNRGRPLGRKRNDIDIEGEWLAAPLGKTARARPDLA
jgi:hypothetical protein